MSDAPGRLRDKNQRFRDLRLLAAVAAAAALLVGAAATAYLTLRRGERLTLPTPTGSYPAGRTLSTAIG